MAEEKGQERTEQATSRRREQARQEGNFATSREVSTLFMVAAGIVVLYFSSTWMYSGMAEVMKKYFHVMKGDLTVVGVDVIFRDLTWSFLMIIAPALVIPAFGALSYILQNGLNFTAKPLSPDFNKINPLSGIKKLFSINAVAELVKSILTVWVIAVIAVIDYGFQRWNFEKGLRMSKEEIKEEMKETEGDPLIKARIRSMQRDMARKRMMQEVPKADVVLTNPTHLAVAIRYDRAKANAPIVVAKGAGLIAEKIREIARKNNVPVLENKPLARSLYKGVKAGAEIPSALS